MPGLKKLIHFKSWSTTLIFHESKDYPYDLIDTFSVSNFDTDWTSEYHKKNFFRIDPVVSNSIGYPNHILTWEELYKKSSSKQETNFIKASGDFFEYKGLTVGIKTPDKNETCLVVLANECDTQDPKNHLILKLLAADFALALGRVHRTTNENMISPTQLRILDLIADGLTMEQIAKELGRTKRTMTYHVEEIKRSLNASNIPSAIAEALRYRVLES